MAKSSKKALEAATKKVMEKARAEKKSAKPKKMIEQSSEILEIQEIRQDELELYLVGKSPLIMHRYPFKAWCEMLLPSRTKNQAELEQTLKHVPLEEYRESFYRNRGEREPTLFHLPNGMLHGALAAAAIDIPGAARAQIERLTRVVDVQINLYGTPQIFCAMVRNSGINRSPDVRTRPIFPEWCCKVTVRYVSSIITRRAIGNLMGAAGLIVGIGDWRGQKGGPYGAWRLCEKDDKEFQSIMHKQGRKAQEAAYNNPAFFDQDTADLLTWFDAEVKRREQELSPSRQELSGLRREKPLKANGKAPKTRRGTVVVANPNTYDEEIVGHDA